MSEVDALLYTTYPEYANYLNGVETQEVKKEYIREAKALLSHLKQII